VFFRCLSAPRGDPDYEHASHAGLFADKGSECGSFSPCDRSVGVFSRGGPHNVVDSEDSFHLRVCEPFFGERNIWKREDASFRGSRGPERCVTLRGIQHLCLDALQDVCPVLPPHLCDAFVQEVARVSGRSEHPSEK
jgi:hypothetical protein